MGYQLPNEALLFVWLPRQDSNLDRPIQNRQCYQLHYGAKCVVCAEGFEPPEPQGN